uniref:Ribonuclease n=1 Tax=Megaselia scalaris TaxID=36166 RepID=T1GKT4_MEGSC
MAKITSLESLGPYLSTLDNGISNIYFSDIPEICKTEPCMLGVDEAGRGPVLGPMVYGIAFCPLDKKQVLIDLGCAVPNNSRNKNEIRSKYSLNQISMDSAIGLVQKAIDAGANIAEIYVDTVGPPDKYQEKLKGIFPQCKVRVEKKADSTFPIVSAASICAKVTRDHFLKVWNFREGINVDKFGSGYPGDPVTKRFLVEHMDNVFGFPRLVRFSWSTAENALKGKACDVEFEEVEDEKTVKKGNMMKFLTGKDGVKKREVDKFFKTRCLSSCTEI